MAVVPEAWVAAVTGPVVTVKPVELAWAAVAGWQHEVAAGTAARKRQAAKVWVMAEAAARAAVEAGCPGLLPPRRL